MQCFINLFQGSLLPLKLFFISGVQLLPLMCRPQLVWCTTQKCLSTSFIIVFLHYTGNPYLTIFNHFPARSLQIEIYPSFVPNIQILNSLLFSSITLPACWSHPSCVFCMEILNWSFILERNWNMWIPGFGAEELRPYKRAFHTEAHKQVRNLSVL